MIIPPMPSSAAERNEQWWMWLGGGFAEFAFCDSFFIFGDGSVGCADSLKVTKLAGDIESIRYLGTAPSSALSSSSRAASSPRASNSASRSSSSTNVS